ncbi:hypothetical protein TNIN_174961 [Trichonephila inaurata madagascariensis]|uniref:Uncharacterized protein n=1 Tax=Trichonephila inaurata madagascariensis TaxID=2747483 RepID=A0A8X6YYV1_9ARAC|nr:hypothetical protein TNIN_174961 [Trichonephila inaurata madagascariensis]
MGLRLAYYDYSSTGIEEQNPNNGQGPTKSRDLSPIHKSRTEKDVPSEERPHKEEDKGCVTILRRSNCKHYTHCTESYEPSNILRHRSLSIRLEFHRCFPSRKKKSAPSCNSVFS